MRTRPVRQRRRPNLIRAKSRGAEFRSGKGIACILESFSISAFLAELLGFSIVIASFNSVIGVSLSVLEHG
jgi:hypothetical protein